MSLKDKFAELTGRLKTEVLNFYGDDLVSLAVFGSVAAQTMVPDSDLDIFICVKNLPRGRMRRIEDFQVIEDKLTDFLKQMRQEGIYTTLSPVIKTSEEMNYGSLIFIDMTENVKILHDKESFLAGYLSDLKEKLKKLGSRKIKRGSAWFWDLIPNYKLVREVSL